MKIDGKELKLKLTPFAIKKVEEMDEELDILKLIREARNEGKEPRLSDYYKVIYTAYIGTTNEDIDYATFLKKIEDINILEINSVGINLLMQRKN